MESELYVKVKIKNSEVSNMDLEKIFYQALKEHIGRKFNFPEDDIVVVPMEFYVPKERL